MPMKEPVPHFNEPLSLPPEIGTNFKSDRRSAEKILDNFFTEKYFIIHNKNKKQVKFLINNFPFSKPEAQNNLKNKIFRAR